MNKFWTMRIGGLMIQFVSETVMLNWKVPAQWQDYATTKTKYVFLAPRNKNADMFINN